MSSKLDSPFTTEDDLFFFETDHLALKGNKDYCDVLKTIVILSAQREKTIKDYNKVVELRAKAIEDPFHTLEKIKNGEDLGVPRMFELPKIPVINFGKYEIKVSEEELKKIYSDQGHNKPEEDTTNAKPSNTNNTTWTPEEQKKLEELLVVYPPEPIEIRRFQKIAKALGNRTVQQVTSRVQKYFLKLYKAGLPIPGRIPKSGEKYKKYRKQHRHTRAHLWKPTTFFPDMIVPVMMNDLENIPGPSINFPSTSVAPPGTSNYLVQSDYHNATDTGHTRTKCELQLDLLKRIKKEKLKEEEPNYNTPQHLGYRCDYCDSEPIVGSRWHCMSCNDSVDFCTDCVLSQMYSDNSHPLHHILAVFGTDSENPNLELSDSESYAGSSNTNKNGSESDSNCSDDYERQDLEQLQQNESIDSDMIMDESNDYEFKSIPGINEGASTSTAGIYSDL